MKRSILRRLIGIAVGLAAIIAVLVVTLLASDQIDRGVVVDTRYLEEVRARLDFIAARSALLATDPNVESTGFHVREIHSAYAELAGLTRPVFFLPVEEVSLPDSARTSLTAVSARLHTSWQKELDAFLESALASYDAPHGRDDFIATVPQFVSRIQDITTDVGETITQVQDARKGVARIFLRALSVLLAAAAFSLVGYAIASLVVLRREFHGLLALSAQISEGDFADIPESSREDEIGDLSRRIREMSSLESVVSALRTTSQRLTAEYGRITDGVARTVSSVKSQARVVEETSRRFVGIVESVRKVEENAGTSLEVANEGSRALEKSLDRITQGMEATRRLEEHTARIDEVVSLIGDVADQTELLSLNASIEAARAGEAGRGFTVVAQQVRKLADRSARAASEITDLVQAVLGSVRRVAADAKESFDMSEALKRDLEKIAQSIRSIAGLSRTASDGVGQAESSMGTMLGLATDTSRKVDELAASNDTLREIIVHVDKVLRRFSPEERERSRIEEGPVPPLPLSLGIKPVETEEEAAMLEELSEDVLGPTPSFRRTLGHVPDVPQPPASIAPVPPPSPSDRAAGPAMTAPTAPPRVPRTQESVEEAEEVIEEAELVEEAEPVEDAEPVDDR